MILNFFSRLIFKLNMRFLLNFTIYIYLHKGKIYLQGWAFLVKSMLNISVYTNLFYVTLPCWLLFVIQIAIVCVILIPLGVYSDVSRKLNV